MIEKVAVKNERPGIMLTPALRPVGEDRPEEAELSEEEHAPAKA
jgi:hypothetical protein